MTINAVVEATLANGSNRMHLVSDNQLEVEELSSSMMTDDWLCIHILLYRDPFGYMIR
jgi:hypothetical protein